MQVCFCVFHAINVFTFSEQNISPNITVNSVVNIVQVWHMFERK